MLTLVKNQENITPIPPFPKRNYSVEGIDVEHVKNVIDFGRQLYSIRKTVAEGHWLEFVDSHYGYDKRATCQLALYLSTKDIPEEEYKLGIIKLRDKCREFDRVNNITQKSHFCVSREMSPETKLAYDSIKQNVADKNINLAKRLKKGLRTKLAKQYGIPVKDVQNALSKLRKEKGVLSNSKPFNEVKRNIKHNKLRQCAAEDRQFRNSPTMEEKACRIISKLILSLPQGGAALYIGTPAPFCASKSSDNQLLYIDNLAVCIILQETTDAQMKIVVGNAVDPIKAELKVQDWLSNNWTNKCSAIMDKVDKITFMHHVTKFVEQNNHTICKVVLMASGAWNGKKKKHGLDLNFEEPSLYLTSIYKNLHIIPMVRIPGKYIKFGARHLHDGKNELITEI